MYTKLCTQNGIVLIITATKFESILRILEMYDKYTRRKNCKVQ